MEEKKGRRLKAEGGRKKEEKRKKAVGRKDKAID